MTRDESSINLSSGPLPVVTSKTTCSAFSVLTRASPWFWRIDPKIWIRYLNATCISLLLKNFK